VRIDPHPPAPLDAAPTERKRNVAVRLDGSAFDNGPINFVDRAAFEQLAETRQRLGVTAEHQTAGRLPVETVGDFRPARQTEAQRIEMVEQRFTALGTGMHGETGRLVEHQHEAVAVKHAACDLVRSQDAGSSHDPAGRSAATTRRSRVVAAILNTLLTTAADCGAPDAARPRKMPHR